MRYCSVTWADKFICRSCGVVVITSASHAEGRGFDPRHDLCFFKAFEKALTYFYRFWFRPSSNRKQRVVLNENFSIDRPITSGALQESVLKPTLFLLYVTGIGLAGNPL